MYKVSSGSLFRSSLIRMMLLLIAGLTSVEVHAEHFETLEASKPTMQRFKLDAAQLRAWLEHDPEVQRILSLPESSPERDLFESLMNETLSVLETEKTSVSFSGFESKSLINTLFYGATTRIMQSPPSSTLPAAYPEYLGLIMNLQFMAMDSISAEIPHIPFNRFMGGIQFILQAMASGHHSPDEIRELATQVDVVITDDVRNRRTTTTLKASDLLKVLETFGVPLSLDGKTIAPHWRYWNVHDRRVLESPPIFKFTDKGPMSIVETRQARSIFDALMEQTKPKERPEKAAQNMEEWIQSLKTSVDWRTLFPQHFTTITGEQKEEIIRTVLNLVEPYPTKFSSSVAQALNKLAYMKSMRIDSRKARQIWREIFEKSLPIVYDLRKKKLELDAQLKKAQEERERESLRLKAEEAAKKEIENQKSERKAQADKVHQRIVELLHTTDAYTTFLSLHATFMAEIYRSSMIEGRSSIPELSELESPQDPAAPPAKALDLISNAIAKEQDHDPVLKAHLSHLQKIAKAKLQRDLNDRDLRMIRELQVLVFRKRIEQMTDTTTKISLQPEEIQNLMDLGLYGTLNPTSTQLEIDRLNDPFRLYRTPSLHVRDGESDTKVLKRNSAKARGLSTEDPSQLATHLFKRMHVFEVDFWNLAHNPEAPPFTDQEMDDLEFETKEDFDVVVRYGQSQLYRTLKVIVAKNPSSPAELKGYLADSTLMKGLTGSSEKIFVPDWMAAQIMNQAQFIMHAMTYPTSCREAILNFVPSNNAVASQ